MRYLTTTEAAVLLDLDPSRVRVLCATGRIRAILVGGRYGISEHEVARFADIPRVPGRPAKEVVHRSVRRTALPSSNLA